LARIVITCFGSYGDLYPYLGLALGLQARGHRTVLASSAFYRDAVEREGVEFRPIRPDVDPTDRDLMRRVMHARNGTEFIVRSLLDHLRESYEDLAAVARGADLIVTHPITFAGPLVAQRQNLPWVSSVLAPISFLSAQDLPVFAQVPWTRPLARLPGASRAVLAIARLMTRMWVRPVAALRRDLGLPPGGHPIFEGQHAPRLVLALFSRVLADPQPDWPANVRVTGAIPYNGPSADRPLSADIEAFLDAGPPPIVFTLGSSAVNAAGDFYAQSVDAVRRIGARALLLAGTHPENRPTTLLPDDVRLVDAAPHAALFPRASMVVHQGGAGTLHHALRSGRPMVVVPFAHDQPDNAYRVERLGVARTIRADRYTAARVARELRVLTGDDAWRVRAAAVGTRVQAEDAVGSACDAIEEVLGS
jgi:rhamnosyltransferase subunit B